MITADPQTFPIRVRFLALHTIERLQRDAPPVVMIFRAGDVVDVPAYIVETFDRLYKGKPCVAYELAPGATPIAVVTRDGFERLEGETRQAPAASVAATVSATDASAIDDDAPTE